MGGASGLDAKGAEIVATVSMPHAALWVVQLANARDCLSFCEVSMPHAALWVVQLNRYNVAV